MTYPMPCPKCNHFGTDIVIRADFLSRMLTMTCPECRYTVTSVNDDSSKTPLEIWNEMVIGEAEIDRIRAECQLNALRDFSGVRAVPGSNTGFTIRSYDETEDEEEETDETRDDSYGTEHVSNRGPEAPEERRRDRNECRDVPGL
nr:MAG TPA: Transcription elongation factor Elf1 like [Caudoviricetes sp.]